MADSVKIRVTPPWIHLEDDTLGIQENVSKNASDCEVEPPWYRGSTNKEEEGEYIRSGLEARLARRNLLNSRNRAISSLHSVEINENNQNYKEYRSLQLRERQKEVENAKIERENMKHVMRKRHQQNVAQEARRKQEEKNQQKESVQEYLENKRKVLLESKTAENNQKNIALSEMKQQVQNMQELRKERKRELTAWKRELKEISDRKKEYKAEKYQDMILQKQIEEFYIDQEKVEKSFRSMELDEQRKQEMLEEKEKLAHERKCLARRRNEISQRNKADFWEEKKRKDSLVIEKQIAANRIRQQEENERIIEHDNCLKEVELQKQRRINLYQKECDYKARRLAERGSIPLELRAKLGKERRQEEKEARVKHQSLIEKEMRMKSERRAMLKQNEIDNGRSDVKSLLFC